MRKLLSLITSCSQLLIVLRKIDDTRIISHKRTCKQFFPRNDWIDKQNGLRDGQVIVAVCVNNILMNYVFLPVDILDIMLCNEVLYIIAASTTPLIGYISHYCCCQCTWNFSLLQVNGYDFIVIVNKISYFPHKIPHVNENNKIKVIN